MPQVSLRVTASTLLLAETLIGSVSSQPYVSAIAGSVTRSDVLRIAIDLGLRSLQTDLLPELTEAETEIATQSIEQHIEHPDEDPMAVLDAWLAPGQVSDEA